MRLAALKAGKSCGLFTIGETMAADRRRQGFQMAVLAYDQDLIQSASKSRLRRFKDQPGKDLLKGAVALVSGCNRSIGPETVRALLKAGAAKIYVGARKLDGVKALVAEAPDKLVPIEPTAAMLTKGGSAALQAGGTWREAAREAYRAMLAASPECAAAPASGEVQS